MSKRLDLNKYGSVFDRLEFLDADDVKGRISTGVPTVDIVCGGNGIPVGRICEIFSEPSCGKSTVALSIVHNVLRSGGLAVYFDGEYSLDESRIDDLGMSEYSNNQLIVGHPTSIEEMFETARDLLPKLRTIAGKEVPIVMVIDSVTSFPARAELEGSNQINRQPAAFNEQFRRSIGIFFKTGVTLIAISQTREKIGVMFGQNVDTPGGKALKFYASIRIHMQMKKRLNGSDLALFGFQFDPELPCGHIATFKAVKNKTADPFKVLPAVLLYSTGFHEGLSIFYGLEAKKLLMRKGKEYTVRDHKDITFNKRNALEVIEKNRDILIPYLNERVYGSYVGGVIEEDMEEDDE